MAFTPSGGATAASIPAGIGDGQPHLAVRLWLYAVAALILIMIVVGGATRLTNSGLSITEWKPLLGAIPPLNDADWQDAFRKYQEIPQYKLINRGMSLGEFKAIYWWEWAHRFLGRFIGVVFFVPFLVFWRRGVIPRAVMPRLGGIFLLGAAQGALGWYMVASGLVDRVSVSQYRLAAHLGLAVVVLAAILWVAFDLERGAGRARATGLGWLRAGAATLAGLIYLQIVAGGFVAGLHAGMAYNTWPLMDGALIPNGLGAMQPWYINLFENALTVQFDHRMLAYAIAALALLNVLATWRPGVPGALRAVAMLLLAAVIAQAALGVFTLLSQVQIGLALAHQAGAILVFGIALRYLHQAERG